MKKIIVFSLLSLPLFSNAQDNKPEANSFGLQYGVNFNGAIGQAVQLSGWLKNGLEVRGSMTFTYLSTQSTTVNINNYAAYNGSSYVPGTETSTSSSANLAITPTISVVKHIPLKSNLDFFIGGSGTVGVSVPTAWTKISSTTIADSSYSYQSTNTKDPLTLTWGLSLVGGANYFFYKNLAIGADFGLGFSASNENGTYHSQNVEVNTGSYNQNVTNGNYNYTTNNKITSSRYSASLTGNAGLHLTYYLKVSNKKKTGEQKM